MSNSNHAPAGSPEGGQFARGGARAESDGTGLFGRRRSPMSHYVDDADVTDVSVGDGVLRVRRTLDTSSYRRNLDAEVAKNPNLAVRAVAAAHPGAQVDGARGYVTCTTIRPGRRLEDAVMSERAVHEFATSAADEAEIAATYRDFGYGDGGVIARVDASSARVQSVVNLAIDERAGIKHTEIGINPGAANARLAYPRRGSLDPARARSNVSLPLSARGFVHQPPVPGQPSSIDVFHRPHDDVWLASDADEDARAEAYSSDAEAARNQEIARVDEAIARAWRRRGVSAADAVQRVQCDDDSAQSVPAKQLIDPMRSRVTFDGMDATAHAHFVRDTSDDTLRLRKSVSPVYH